MIVRILKMCPLRVSICIFVIFYLSAVSCQSEKKVQLEKLCSDPDCSEPISLGRSYVPYLSNRDGYLSFKKGAIFEIFSKPKNADKKWGYLEVRSTGRKVKMGRVPPSLIQEIEIYTPNLVTVLTDEGKKAKEEADKAKEVEVTPTQYPGNGVAAEAGNGGAPSTPITVVDSTTLALGLDGEETIVPPATKEPTLQTEIPVVETKQPSPTSSSETLSEEEEDDEVDDTEEEEEETTPEPKTVQSPAAAPSVSQKVVSDEIQPTPTVNSNLPSHVTTKIKMSETMDLIDSALNVEPGKSKEMDDLILKRFAAEDLYAKKLKVAYNSKIEADKVKAELETKTEAHGSPTTTIPEALSSLPTSGLPETGSTSDTLHSTTLPEKSSLPQTPEETSKIPMNSENVASIPPNAQKSPHGEPEPKPILEKTAVPPSGNQPTSSVPVETVTKATSENNQPNISSSLPVEEKNTQNNDSLPSNNQTVSEHPTVSKESPNETVTEEIPLAGKDSNILSKNESAEEVPTKDEAPLKGESSTPETKKESSMQAASDDLLKESSERIERKEPPVETAVKETHHKLENTEPSKIHSDPTVTENPKNVEASASSSPPSVETSSVTQQTEATPSDDGPIPNTNSSDTNLATEDPRNALPNYEETNSTEASSPIPNNIVGTTDDPTYYETNSTDASSSVPNTIPSVTEDPRNALPTYHENTVETSPPIANGIPSIPEDPRNVLPTYLETPPESNDIPAITEPPVAETDPIGLPNSPPNSDPRLALPSFSDSPGPDLPHRHPYPGLFPKIDPTQRPSGEPEERNEPIGIGTIEPVTNNDLEKESEEVVNADGGGFFDGILSSIFGSDPSPDPQLPLHGDVPSGECKTLDNLETDCSDAPSPQHLWNLFEKTVPETSYSLLYLVITSITVLIFTLGYYFIERTRQDGPLIAKVNKLTHDLQVAKSQLEAHASQEPYTLTESNGEALAALQTEISDLKQSKKDLEIQIESLQQELEAATEAGLEMNKMLADVLSQQQDTGPLMASVVQLQGQLDIQQKEIDTVNQTLKEKINENDDLQKELTSAIEKVDTLNEEINELRQSLTQLTTEKEDLVWSLESKINDLTSSNEKEVSVLNKTVAELNEKVALKDSEYLALKETIEELKSQSSHIDSKSIYDIGHIKAALARTQAEKDALQERLKDEEGARKLLEHHVKSVDEEVASLRSSFEEAEKAKTEAETRLSVLSNYFKEKETQLQKELGLQEAILVQKQGDEVNVYERIKMLQEEVESYNFDSLSHSNEGVSLVSSESLTTMPRSSPSPKLGSDWSLVSLVSNCHLDSLPLFSSPPPIIQEINDLVDLSPPPQDNKQNISQIEHPSLWPEQENTRLFDFPRLPLIPNSPIKTSPPTSPIPDLPLIPIPKNEINEKHKTLPTKPTPKPRFLVRRTSSVEFEAKLERVQLMMATDAQPCKKLPDDLVKLQEVRANSKQDESNTDLMESKETPLKCSQLVEKFENIMKPMKVLNAFNDFSKKKRTVTFGPYSNAGKTRYDETAFINDEKSLVPVTPDRSSTTDVSESEESHSLSKDSELESSATLEFDIKVVANASSNVKKFKKKIVRQKIGAQNEMLKKEVTNQECELKTQIASLEKKARESWVSARQAERKLDESKQEASLLRNKLTLMEKSLTAAEPPKPGGPSSLPGELNGEDPIAPILAHGNSPLPLPPMPLDFLAGPPPMLPPGPFPPFTPPLPGGFLPMPPFHPSRDRRPPPLGRMSSPPLNCFSPPPPTDLGFPPRGSPPPMSPPGRNYRSSPARRTPPSPVDDLPPRSSFRPVASHRDTRRDAQGSNSGHSSSPPPDKPRRRGRV